MKRSLFTAIAFLPFVAFACSSSPVPGEQGPTPTPGPAEPACPATTGPTIHSGDLADDEVWTAEGSPHIVERTVTVRNARTLTIEPCATVRFADKAGISVATPITPNQGTLIAEGTASRPIRFEGKEGARWGHVFIQAPGTARLAHVTIDGAGGDGAPAALVAYGTAEMPLRKDLFVDHVTVTNAAGIGVKVARIQGFADGSTDLVIKGSGKAPLETSEYALGTLPTGAFTGNAVDEIAVDPEGWIEESMTMRALGVPYRIGDSEGDDLRVGRDKNRPLVTLTIEPGNTLRFQKGSALSVEHFTGTFPASGALVAVGTKDKPIVFTSAKATPAPGDWRGLWFGGIARAENRIENIRLEYTGAWCGCILLTCSAIDSFAGAVIFSQPPPSAFIKDAAIVRGAGHGFVLGYDGATIDFKANNTFEDLGGCAMTLPRSGACPAPKPACK